jgi:DNA-binding transcriptional regulator GbsR (MarR family)
MADAGTVKDVMTFLGMSASEFMREWKRLSDTAKMQFKNGVGKGTFDAETNTWTFAGSMTYED